jgi:hypothetical protein
MGRMRSSRLLPSSASKAEDLASMADEYKNKIINIFVYFNSN